MVLLLGLKREKPWDDIERLRFLRISRQAMFDDTGGYFLLSYYNPIVLRTINISITCAMVRLRQGK